MPPKKQAEQPPGDRRVPAGAERAANGRVGLQGSVQSPARASTRECATARALPGRCSARFCSLWRAGAPSAAIGALRAAASQRWSVWALGARCDSARVPQVRLALTRPGRETKSCCATQLRVRRRSAGRRLPPGVAGASRRPAGLHTASVLLAAAPARRIWPHPPRVTSAARRCCARCAASRRCLRRGSSSLRRDSFCRSRGVLTLCCRAEAEPQEHAAARARVVRQCAPARRQRAAGLSSAAARLCKARRG
jgi:hypothetical protein